MADQKQIKYINKDFASFKQALTDYSKTYFSSTYNDFSPSSPGTMFMEMASYVGDVLAFYQDNQFQEVFTQYAKEKENLYTLAYMLGYRPKVTTPSSVVLDVYQTVPAIASASVTVPDYRYALVIEPGSQVKSTVGNIDFYIKDRIDFSASSSFDPITVTVASLDGGNLPNFYLLKKSVKAISGTETSTTFTFGDIQRYPNIELEDTNIIEITSVTDSDNNIWYEVPYLAQETIFQEISNDVTNDPNFASYSNTTPYLLKLKRVPRRFVTRFKSTGTLNIEFGVGAVNDVDEVLTPNPDNVGIGLIDGLNKLNTAWDPSNFLYTKTYGIAPSNTTLTVKYLVGGGVNSNVPANSITDISNIISSFKYGSLDGTLSNIVINSLAITNPSASSGGGDGDTEEDLRLNTLSAFPAQQRAVGLQDYLIRAYSLPSKFGTIAKAYIVQDSQLENNVKSLDYNPLALSLYILSQEGNGNLSIASLATKQNLKTYLSNYKMLTDAVNIKDAFIINIGVNFDIIVRPNFNNQQVIVNCIDALKDYFDIKKWQINQPIILSEIYTLLDKIEGVQTVKSVDIINKSGEALGYSKYAYDINGATRNRVIYPSLDPSIFEVKFPNIDLSGRTSNF